MKFHYISPSTVPSRSANSVHVIMQSDALARMGVEVSLFAKRSLADDLEVMPAVREAYGVGLPGSRIVSFYSRISRADNLRIARLAAANLRRGPWPDAILSRNLYAAFYLSVLRRKPLLFETHQLEYGFRRSMQRAVMTCPSVTTVVISENLLNCLQGHHGVGPSRAVVLRDAAPDGIEPVPVNARRAKLAKVAPEATDSWVAVCGYFGQLFSGRGVEVIEAMAEARPRVLFLVFGGADSDVASRRANNRYSNLKYLGYVPHPVGQEAMQTVDVLLMPYQENVSIGVTGHDTGRWMSPMKMFEYMASGVPIISSDLPALREVLHDNVNALLVDPRDSGGWVAALDRLIADPALAERLGSRAHEDYRSEYTWGHRARSILAAAAEGS